MSDTANLYGPTDTEKYSDDVSTSSHTERPLRSHIWQMSRIVIVALVF
jgi:hypothetical protein